MKKPSDILVDVYRPGRSMYLKFTTTLHESFLVVCFITVPIFIFLFIAQLDYIQNRYKKDFSVLSIEKGERFNYLKKEELRLYAKETTLQNDFRFEEVKQSRENREKMQEELNAIAKEAPYTSWAYNFYVAVGAIDPF